MIIPKAGDRVLRIGDTWNGVNEGQIYIVKSFIIDENKIVWIALDGIIGNNYSEDGHAFSMCQFKIMTRSVAPMRSINNSFRDYIISHKA